jgi:hypothetical protein
MIRFAGHVIEVKKLFPKAENKRFVKKAMGPGLSMLTDGLGKGVEMLASKLHGVWADGFRAGEMAKGNENPTRMKDDGMGGQVDILNTSYSDLPPKWQAENKAQAESAIGLVARNMDDAMGNIEGLAAQVHEQWLSRNSWAKDGPLGVPYSELPEEEKQKDRDVIIAAHEILSEMKSGQQEMPEEMESENSDMDDKTNI